ncbi:MAG: hypothetical protein Lokiarch_11850 [Candidatus Lokiarchaeum sp. GC14_75]|nr:MAG: hypothetical protein Lokiarch_11850 [Candidatus Lokiarchaeum sp. GC14_75]
MTARKLKPKDLTICDKCGNVMITKKIRTNNSNRVEFQNIMQCIVCRFWISND